MEFSKLNLKDLEKLAQRVAREIDRRKNSVKREVMGQIRHLAAKAGLALDDLVGEAPRRRGRKPAAEAAAGKSKPRGRPRKNPAAAAAKTRKARVKYRHPEDASLTWVGRGRKPRWVNDWLEQGRSLEELQ